jgi:hypothetical protein
MGGRAGVPWHRRRRKAYLALARWTVQERARESGRLGEVRSRSFRRESRALVPEYLTGKLLGLLILFLLLLAIVGWLRAHA